MKIIRGGKSTEVRLTLKKADGTIKVISLIRDEIVQDEKFARSVIVSTDRGKIGYIYLPEFYADFENNNGNRCYIDVAKELVKLKEENVDGVVLDLRNNPGGSLGDVVEMVGLFVNQGPVVQVKGREGRPMVLEDHARGALYTGPLTVMVNEFSASASEIFAAAIQDYKRGIIIGSTSTFGKGTVQRPFPLERSTVGVDSGLGTIKLTMEKFYRISGGSTQLRGVTPDVTIPDQYEFIKDREKDDPNALKWDEIAQAKYQFWQPAYDPESIRKQSEERLDKTPSFKEVVKNAKWLNEQNDKTYALELAAYRKQKEALQKTYQDMEKWEKLATPLALTPMPDSVGSPADTGAVTASNLAGTWYNRFKTDIELGEAVNIMGDMIKAGTGRVTVTQKQ